MESKLLFVHFSKFERLLKEKIFPPLGKVLYYQGYSESSNEDLKKAVSDLQSELVGKIIWQCPRCQMHQCPGTQPVNHKTAAVRAPPPEPVVQGDDGQAKLQHGKI